MIKFVLLGHKRCGSTLLTTSLNCHGRVHMFGEVFNESVEARQKAYHEGLRNHQDGSPPKIAERDYYRGGDAAEFLDRSIYFPRHGRPLAVGFKMFYDDCRDQSDAMKAWSYLIADREIRIVHLYRLNLLDTLLSLSVALRTDEWARLKEPETTARSRALEPFPLALERCEDYFRDVTRLRQVAMDDFREHPILELTYERDICQGYQETYDRVCDFIGMPRTGVQVLLDKQATRKPSEQIKNFAELQRYFSKTEFAHLFE
ncbi:MAG TPA: sulfotransferase domain-containing protein [Blastocatellia bacterium]|nr:sulfotransferase domain-containing protein [Blastocatellia bacterium]